MPVPFPSQLSGALFLAARKSAILADAPRVGKTGAAILACDYVFARRIIVVTTASGRPNWAREFRDWGFPRCIQVIYSAGDRVRPDAEVVITGWGLVADPALLAQLTARRWQVFIADEGHYAKNPDTQRTRAVFGRFADDGLVHDASAALAGCSDSVWNLTGTPTPTGAHELYPFLRACLPATLREGGTDVTRLSAFTRRYCTCRLILTGAPLHVLYRALVRSRPVVLKADPAKGWAEIDGLKAFSAHYGLFDGKTVRRRVEEFEDRVSLRPGLFTRVVTGTRNADELRARIGGILLRRTQKDVGIRPPVYSIFSLKPAALSSSERQALAAMDARASDILDAAEAGRTSKLDLHLGPLRRITGLVTARALIGALKDELDSRLDKVVLMAWHQDVVDLLKAGLVKYGVVGIDGRTPSARRAEPVAAFTAGNARVFVGQIQAAGENIDLSVASELFFVEMSFNPKDMAQAALRITNHKQTRQCFVRVCALEGGINEALMRIVTRRVATMRPLMEN